MVESTVQVVIGAGGGIGSALSRSLHKAGATVVLAGRSEEPLAEVGDELGLGWTSLDASDFGAVEQLVEDAVSEHGRVDGIACLAGSLLLKPAHLTTEDDYAATIAQNLTAAFATVRAAAKAMRREGGAIVLMSSAAAHLGLANHEAIAAAKAGIDGLVRSAAATYGAKGVRVNAVAPGLTRSKLTEKLTSNEAQAEASRDLHVLGRFGEPEEPAAAVQFLLDPSNSWITGQVLNVDGGLGHVRTR